MSETHQHQITGNLFITEDLTYLCLCPCCGAPDCGEEYMLLTESEERQEAVLFGGGTFRGYLNYWFYEGISPEEYSRLPEFVRRNNECVGWQDISAQQCTEIDADDFMLTLESIKNGSCKEYPNEDFENYYYPVFKKLVKEVMRKGQKLYISI
ncbi:hypothetical protein HHL23_20240 [Chryseobacterium sp. RP-3-3]|uniref:Uncharacterized protein n=1 Tax=Chryseobacterium antibioticum TaxID=2728847 RepID=A0A7Y0ARB9_9FLAO|nr:hypothetical protein [Chryseobacterium antibioticum]NML72101.1 hypothetical protein [Chryseobacterium antibioticum]